MRDALRTLIDQLRLHGMADVLDAEIERAEREAVPATELLHRLLGQEAAFRRERSATWRAARPQIEVLSEAAVREALERLDPLWEELFPAEQARIVQLLVARVDVTADGLELHLRTQGLGRVVHELAGIGMRRAA